MNFYPLKIKEIRKETADCVSILFESSGSADFKFTPGQYLTLKANIGGEELRRSYSICAAPYENELRIAVKKVEGGKFSGFANEKLRKGDVLEVAQPEGRFFPKDKTLETKCGQHYVLVASGSGITPIVSILKAILKNEPQSQVTLIYGNKNAASVIFREEIEGLKNKNMGKLRVFNVLSRERVDSEWLHGRIDKQKMAIFLEKIPEILKADAFFLCGPQDMIHDVRELLSEHHIENDRVHFELFGTTKTKRAQTVVSTENIVSVATIKLDGISFEVPIREGEVVLDAALRLGADLPFACKGGVCCTCRAMLTQGTVDMEVNYALDHHELERGYILTCQALPKTPNLMIDFDIK
jgi:ring-1,2-phenylacetyl-CoA epoxidase subunit PaaE